jgi:hypothetical protein
MLRELFVFLFLASKNSFDVAHLLLAVLLGQNFEVYNLSIIDFCGFELL